MTELLPQELRLRDGVVGRRIDNEVHMVEEYGREPIVRFALRLARGAHCENCQTCDEENESNLGHGHKYR